MNPPMSDPKTALREAWVMALKIGGGFLVASLMLLAITVAFSPFPPGPLLLGALLGTGTGMALAIVLIGLVGLRKDKATSGEKGQE